MTWHWKQLLPVDRFSVRTSQYITELDQLTLTLLYQPLIGAIANSFYGTLLAQLEKDQYWSREQTHRQLMLLLGTSLEVIFEERKKLEGIGLLKTFKRKDDEGTTYLYELQPPMTPKQFFENDVLSVYLFNRLGKTHYRQLRERFILDAIDKDEYTETTYAFDEVFASLHHSEMVSNLKSETSNALTIDSGQELITKASSSSLTFDHDFDFDTLEKSVSRSVNPSEVFTTEVRQAISRLAFVYRIEPLEMSSIVLQALLHDDQLNIEELRKKVQEWYKIEHGTEPPALAMRTQPVVHQQMNGKVPTTDEERTVQFYETTPPLSLLEIRSDGAKVALADVKIIESLMMDHNLNPGVINVLLDLMLWSHDMKLSKALIDKIAGHWSRKKVKTVPEAMTLALQEQNKNKPKQSTASSYKRQPGKTGAVRRDKLPKWLLAEKEKDKSVEVAKKSETTNDEADKEKSFAQLLEERRKMKE